MILLVLLKFMMMMAVITIETTQKCLNAGPANITLHRHIKYRYNLNKQLYLIQPRKYVMAPGRTPVV